MLSIRRQGRILAALLTLAVLLVVLVRWLPDGLVRHIPVVTGAAWTGALLYLDVRLRRGGGEAWWTSLRWGVASCGLLTVLLLLLDVREHFGWPEAVVGVAALAALVRWVWRTAVELGQARRQRAEPPRQVLGLRPRERQSWSGRVPPRTNGKRQRAEKWDA